MNRNLMSCFLDAHRRRGIHKNRPKDELMEWVGLGTKTAYKDALKEGYMEWACGVPTPRCMGWLRFTKKGLAKYKEILPEIEAQYKSWLRSW